MKSITFNVTLDFSSDINSDSEIKEIMENIVSGITTQYWDSGLSPNDRDDVMTNSLVIREQFSGLEIDEQFLLPNN